MSGGGNTAGRRGPAQRTAFLFTSFAVLAAVFAGRAAAVGPPRDMLVILNKSDGTATVIDIASGRAMSTIRVGTAPHEVAILPGGRVAVVSNYGTAEAPGRSLTLIDLQRQISAGSIFLPAGARPHGLAAISADRVLVTAEGLKELLVVEPRARRVLDRIPIGRETSHMVVATRDGLRAFVANIGSGSVSVVDIGDKKTIAEIPTGAGAEGIAFRPNDTELWVTNRDANTISIIDPVKLAVVATIKAPEFPIRVKFTPDGRRALVSCAKSGNVAVFDVDSRREIRRISIDREAVAGSETRVFSTRFGKSPVPVGILIAPDGKRAWVASTNADVVSTIDLDRLEVIGRITAGKEPDGLAGAFKGHL